MGIKDENTRRIRKLEEEFSDERIAEFFQIDDAQPAAALGRRKRKAALCAVLAFGIAVLCVAVALRFYTPWIMPDATMGSAIEKMDCVIVAKHAYGPAGPGLGDIILYGSSIPDGGGGTRELIGRVIGLPGDEVEIQAWGVYRNGGLLDEPYLEAEGGAGAAWMRATVPEGSCFVLADSRTSGIDSRDGRVGFVAEADIHGKAVFRLLPVSRAGVPR